ncbi:MAG: hypothetical protein QOI41_827, partial [Myxococcales bacterium]|nr:hypothetical protein [Myxococcales bacterium]
AAAVVLLAGTAYQRSKAAALAEPPLVMPSADPPPEASGVPVGVQVGVTSPATGVVTAPVHMVSPEAEGTVGNVQNGVQAPQGTVIGASPSGTAPAPPAATGAPGAATNRKPNTAAPSRPTAASPPAVKRPSGMTGAGGTAKPLLPPGLPRERQ